MIKDISILFNGKEAIVKMKRLTFGEMNQLTEEATDVKVVNGQPIVKVSQKALKEIGLLKSIVEAPFTIDLNSIQNLEAEIGSLLFDEFTELNSQTVKKKD
jgi:hypothetical protein